MSIQYMAPGFEPMTFGTPQMVNIWKHRSATPFNGFILGQNIKEQRCNY